MNQISQADNLLPFLGARAKRHLPSIEPGELEPDSLPGEFANDTILRVAATAFEVSSVDLARALSAASPAVRVSGQTDFRSLSERLMQGIHSTPLTVLSCALSAAVASADLDRILAIALDSSSGSGVAADVSWSYLLSVLRTEATSVCSDVIVFELNAGFQHGLIQSEDPDTALSEMRGLLDDASYVAYLREKYPLLEQRLATRLGLAATSVCTILERLSEDSASIRATFGHARGDFGDDSWGVSAIETTSGDSHNGASRVTFIRFTSGCTVVYKPRTVDGELGFQDYLRFLERFEPALNFRKLTVLARDTYGWVEYVESTSAESEAEIKEYFFRYGALIAALDAISATDIHFENLVAAGAHPVVIDLETIFQPSEVHSIEDGKGRALLSLDFYNDTPLVTAMFDPAFLKGSLNGSPLSRAVDAPGSELAVTRTDGVFTLTAAETVSHTGHIPKLAGGLVDFEPYIDDILDGFVRTARLIARRRSDFINGVLEGIFSGSRVRVIFRYTRHYATMVKAVNSAYALQSLRNTEEILSRLWRTVSVAPGLTSVIAAEHHDVWNGDIPYFQSSIGSASAISSQGLALQGVFPKDGWDVAMTRVLAKDHGRIKQESDLMEFCLRAKAKDLAQPQGTARLSDGELSEPPREAVATLKAIQNRLVLNDGRILTMDIVMHRNMRTRQSVLGTDLYTGTNGICFALAYGDDASRAGTPSDGLRALCEASLTADSHERMLETGICHGVGSGIYFAAHLASLWHDPYMQALGEHLAEHGGRVLYTDRHFDLFSGAAGFLCALLSLRGGASAGKLDGLIERTVDHLIAHSHISGGTMSWLSSIPAKGPTTGYAHGVAGIAHALLRAGIDLDLKRAVDAASMAERFLASCRVDGAGWRECHADEEAAPVDMWCHGTSGIALFYQAIAAVSDDERIRETAVFALDEAERVAPFENDSLCHGWLGNLEVLLNAQAISGGTSKSSAVRACLDDLNSRPARCGTERHHTSLGLFTGLSGIAYQRLRCVAPAEFPSILTFSAPLR